MPHVCSLYAERGSGTTTPYRGRRSGSRYPDTRLDGKNSCIASSAGWPQNTSHPDFGNRSGGPPIVVHGTHLGSRAPTFQLLTRAR